MNVYCIDRDKLERTHAYFGVELGNNVFEVFSIARFKKRKDYLLKFPNDDLRWFSSELFKVKDDSIPDFWIHIRIKNMILVLYLRSIGGHKNLLIIRIFFLIFMKSLRKQIILL